MIHYTDGDADGLAELRTALAITIERRSPQGVLWCPQRMGQRLEREVMSLGRALPGLARQAVRLARVMERSGGRPGYAGFMYRLPLLRAELLSRQLWQAQTEGRLHGVASILDDRLVLHEETMHGRKGERFEMPMAVLVRPFAYLDMVHNMLGFPEVARILAPALADDCEPAAGETVGDTLARTVDAWIRPRVSTQYVMNQGKVIREFLNRRDRTGPEAIDDATILDFWLSVGAVPDPPVDGFRRFRSAARLMLGFRRAERMAAEERDIEGSTGSGGPDTVEGWNPIENAIEGVGYGRFVSPLAVLFSPPADRINWLPGTQLARLDSWLGAEGSEASWDEAVNKRPAGLFAGDPPDPAFARTVLRADVFGAEQNRLINATGQEASTRTQAQFVSYSDVAEDLDRLVVSLQETLAAAAHFLRIGGRVEFLILLDRLDPAARRCLLIALLEQLRPDLSDAIGQGKVALDAEELAALVSKSAVDEAAMAECLAGIVGNTDTLLPKALLRMMSAAAAKHRRVGLRQGDMTDPSLVEGLTTGASALADLVSWTERIASHFGPRRQGGMVRPGHGPDLRAWYEADKTVFHDVFSDLYNADHASG